jgi:hypothetical protein
LIPEISVPKSLDGRVCCGLAVFGEAKRQKQKQIPYGDDNKKGKGKDKDRGQSKKAARSAAFRRFQLVPF